MKTERIIFVLFAMFALSVNAQSDYSSYLNKAMEQLEAGDCESAQKFYNVYKELAGETKPSVQVLIDDCQEDRVYAIGDKMEVGGKTYKVAFVRDGGKHGLAVHSTGWGYVNLREDVVKRGIPTLDELKLIYSNRDKIRLYDIYWSCTWDKKTPANKQSSTFLYTINFSTGEIAGDGDRCCQPRVILKVHRF